MRVSQGGARLDSELLRERSAYPVVLVERVRAAAARVECEHELRMEPLSQGSGCACDLDLLDQPGRGAELEAAVEVLLEQRQLQVLKATQVIARPAVVQQVGQRRSAPKLQGISRGGRCIRQPPRRSQLACLVKRRGGAGGVHLSGIDPQPVTDLSGLDYLGRAAGLPQRRA
jgi:hypothetical protein